MENSNNNGQSVESEMFKMFSYLWNWNVCLHKHSTSFGALTRFMLTSSYLDFGKTLDELYLLIISTGLLEWVCGQMIIVSQYLAANTFIHSSLQNLTFSLSYHPCNRLMCYAWSATAFIILPFKKKRERKSTHRPEPLHWLCKITKNKSS